jgi:hypothetical protein
MGAMQHPASSVALITAICLGCARAAAPPPLPASASSDGPSTPQFANDAAQPPPAPADADAAAPADTAAPASDDTPTVIAGDAAVPVVSATETSCVNADGVGGRDTYALFQEVLGVDALDVFPDSQHMPPVRHIREDLDDVVGPHFVVVMHRDIDTDHLKNDRQRVEITVHTGGPDALKGHDGKTLTYSWRFRFAPDLKTSSSFNIFFQIKSEGGNWSIPIIALVAHDNNLEIHQVSNAGATTVAAGTAFAPLRGQWLEASARATFSHQGAFFMTVKKADGTVVMKADLPKADMWRDGDFTKPKWGIYRSLNDRGALNATEDSVRFANFGITPGPLPTSDCRNGK